MPNLPANLVSPSQWANFKAIQNKWHMEIGDNIITWVRTTTRRIPKMGNDEDKKNQVHVDLVCLFEFNVKRVWPLTQYTDTGEEDKQSEVAILNKEYLRSLNLLDTDGNFAYNPGEDMFIHKGIYYRSAGDTAVSQVPGDDELFYFLILNRAENATA